MSIQTYTKPFVNGNTGTPANMLYGDYICKLAVRRHFLKLIILIDTIIG